MYNSQCLVWGTDCQTHRCVISVVYICIFIFHLFCASYYFSPTGCIFFSFNIDSFSEKTTLLMAFPPLRMFPFTLNIINETHLYNRIFFQSGFALKPLIFVLLYVSTWNQTQPKEAIQMIRNNSVDSLIKLRSIPVCREKIFFLFARHKRPNIYTGVILIQ